jgi:hypothetical protein
MNLQEHEVIRLLDTLPGEAIPIGALGTVVMVYEGGKAYELEFIDSSGMTSTLVTVSARDLVGRSEKIPRVPSKSATRLT